MKILNVHQRQINAPAQEVGQVLDSLAGPDDRLWPWEQWPPMRLDGPLKAGATGGHGPVRYSVSEYAPGERVSFRFEPIGLAKGLHGSHWFEVVPGDGPVALRHVIDGTSGLGMWLMWLILIQPLHDALVEDAFDKVQSTHGGLSGLPSQWSPWVRFLRYVQRAVERKPQT